MKKLPYNPFLLWVKDRIRNNRNAIVVINGSTGSGKTYSCISIGLMISKMLDTNFSVKTNIDFSFTELIKKMELPENKKRGTVFIFEEVGAVGGGASSREWQSKNNKLFFSWLQTSRHQNQIFMMTCPTFDNLEAGARRLVHWQMNTSGIDYINKEAFLKPYRVQINSRTGKFYFKYLRTTYQGRKHKFTRLTCPYIGDEIAQEYEEMKNKFSLTLRRKIMDNDKPQIHGNRKVDDEKIVKMMKSGLNTKEMAKYFGVSERTINRHKKRHKKAINEEKRLENARFDDIKTEIGHILT